MSAVSIICFTEAGTAGLASEDVLRRIKAIFFQASGREDFTSEADRQAFCYRWLGVYLEHYPDFSFIAVDRSGEISGYLAGTPNSRSLRTFLDKARDLDAFASYWDGYPAHLHVNVDENARGRGIGGELVGAFLTRCRTVGILGAHVISAKGARNLSFYERCGFCGVATAEVAGRDLIFLGQSF